MQELQIDLAIFTDSSPDNNGYTYAFVAVDIFTNICHAVPIKDKKPAGSIRAAKEVFNNIRVPEVVFLFFVMIMRARGAVLTL